MRKGQVQVYTGDGKGKTTAALGLALRAIGQGFKVYIIQYMKGGAYTGEFISAKNYLPNIEMIQFGRPCIKQQKQMKIDGFSPKGSINKTIFDFVRDDIDCGSCRYCFLNDEVQKDYIKEAFKKTSEVILSGNYDLVILDEVNVALSLGLLELEEFLSLIKKKPKALELVLTGRDAPEELLRIADLVTEMKPHKHYFEKGQMARRGVEY
ncbi:MAG TPA: cob(I)yrinic acid a,c-diamide adenosyltransferase [Candidatus Nanoarchaeia archaeon]|nr:cob(I)yrinic acid a,c-diamide adenosyltransferase [Candidatus Nanoarchaeia archaeon]